MRKIFLLLVLFALTLSMTGCLGGSGNKLIPGNSYLEVEVDWTVFDEPHAARVFGVRGDTLAIDVSSVAARVVYPDSNEVRAKSVKRDSGQAQSVITMEIPAADSTQIYLVAVDEDTQTALHYAVKADVALEKEAAQTFLSDEFIWYDFEWRTDPEHAHLLEGGPLTAPKSEQRVAIPIYVHDPFQIGENPDWGNMYIGLWSESADAGNNTDGWRTFTQYFDNPNVGEDNTVTDLYGWQPYLAGVMFNLPRGGYKILPIVPEVTIHWR